VRTIPRHRLESLCHRQQLFRTGKDFSLTDDFPFLAHLEILPEWEAAARRFLETDGPVMVLGAPDTGKSTLSRYLVYRAYAKGSPVGLVDLDLGQSHLGPPASLGLGLFPPLTPGDDSLFPQGLYFLGQTSPLGSLMEVAVGCRVLADQASAAGVQRLVVNTSGFVQGPGALRLKGAEVELLQPILILALQRERELEPLLRGLVGETIPTLLGGNWEEPPDSATPTPALPPQAGGRKTLASEAQGEPRRLVDVGWQTLRLPVSARANRRDPEVRRLYREERFRRYFQGARLWRLPWVAFTWEGLALGRGRPLPDWRLRQFGQDLGIRVLYGEGQGRRAVLLTEQPLPDPARAEAAGLPDWDRIHWLSWERLQGRLVGLLDGRRRTLALGLIAPAPWDRQALNLLTPFGYEAGLPVRFVKLGKLRLNLQGQELHHV
jgi:polynucleotide 5'-hydroxyl-kinase GRC3/NOL9